VSRVDILIATFQRPAALAVTLTSLTAQTFPGFRVVIADQGERGEAENSAEARAVLRVLRSQGREVEVHKHLPRRGMAEQRQFLLSRARAPYVLFLDDDLILEPNVVERMLRAIGEESCGFVGCAVIGLSFLHHVRPAEQDIEFWDGPVEHNAANLFHVQRIPPGGRRKYRVAWVGGCVLYDAAALRSCGGFGFWKELPREHCGEDVLAQWRVMARFGGCGLIPSGVYCQELPTTVEDRGVDAPRVLGLEAMIARSGEEK